jgi:polyferredoxin/Pyruvate/2-oxoacid:ferredoxin oxidoreductase delta subunit
LSPRAWRRIRQIMQILVLILFLALFVYTNGQRPGFFWTDIFTRLDPLLMLTASFAGRVLVGGLVLATIVLLLTLLFGRVWCGWFCPLGTLLEWLGPRRSRRSPPPEKWRAIKYVLLFVVLFAALLGNQTLIILDPITILNRTLTTAVWPALRYVVMQGELFLYQFPLLWGPLDAVHGAIVQPVFLDVQPVFTLAALIALLFVGLVALNWWAERFWCRYLCPLGGGLGLVSKLAFLRREVGEECALCARCTHQCPTGTINPHENYESDPAECLVCFDCLTDCTREGIGFRWRLPRLLAAQLQTARWRPAAWHHYDPSRRQVLAAAGASVAGVALAGVEPITQRQPAHMIRPPGATLGDFSALCARCSACVRVCPTQGLQASLLEGGLQNVLTPRLVPRLGYCSFSCNACGQVCPTGAIPKLGLVVKQHTPIGLASVDQNRCLPWAYGIPCIACEEACPVEDKAIKLEEIEAEDSRGNRVLVQRPLVVQDLCNGCGICEYQCPMGGEAAIRVYALTVFDDAG